MTTAIRFAKKNDLNRLEIIEKEAFDPQKYDLCSRRQYAYLLNQNSVDILVAEHNGVLCASAIIFYRKNSDLGRLYSVAVSPQYQGVSIGSQLFDAVEARVQLKKKTGLLSEIRADNKAYLEWYQKRGFYLKQVLPAYYPDGVDGLKVMKDLRIKGVA